MRGLGETAPSPEGGWGLPGKGAVDGVEGYKNESQRPQWEVRKGSGSCDRRCRKRRSWGTVASP